MIDTSNIQEDEIHELINNHEQYSVVFDKDLTHGYNNFYCLHERSLNWTPTERPSATRVHTPNYDHDLNILQQEVMDDLTDQNVLLIPQEHNI